MPTIVDSLLVELGLDSAKFVKGQKDAVLALDKTVKYAEKSGKEIEDHGKRASTFFTQLKKDALELFAVYETAKSFINFTENVREQNKELGYAAQRLNLTTEQLSSLQGMANLSGTSVAGLTGTLGNLKHLYEQFVTNPASMDRTLFGYLSGLHLSIKDFEDVNTVLLKLAEAVDKIPDPSRKVEFLTHFGIDQSTINLLIQGADNFRKLRAESEKQVHVSAEATKAAGELTKAWGALSNDLYQFWSDLSILINPGLEKFLNILSDIVVSMNNMLKIPFVKEFIARIANTAPELLGAFKQAFGAVFEWLKSSFNYIWEHVFGFRPFGDALGMGAAAAGAGAGAGGSTGAAGAGAGGGIGLGARAAAGGASAPADTRTWWQRHAPTALGGKEAPLGGTGSVSGGGTAGDHAGAGSGSPGKPNANFTPENAQALRESAARLGTTPEDLATVIGYETEGSFSPSIWGGKGGQYMGLIQFGPPERAQYGANENQTFKEQLGAVERYLKDRGFKPGMGIQDLYSTILAGKPGTNRADSGGKVSQHVARMQGHMAARARMFLNSGALAEAHETLKIIQGHAAANNRGVGVNGSPYDAHGNYVGYESSADTVEGGSAAARRALLLHRGQRHILQDSHASHDHSQHSSSVNVGNVNVHTSSTDAHGIARDMREAMERDLLANHANFGLA